MSSCICIYMCVCVCVSVYLYMCVCVSVYLYMCVYEKCKVSIDVLICVLKDILLRWN